MASESIAHETEGAIDSWAIRARGIIVLVKFSYSETSLKRTPSGPSKCPLNISCKNCAMFVNDQHSTVTPYCDKVAYC